MNVKIRKARRWDIPAVQAVAEISWQSTYKDIIPEDVQVAFLQEAYSKKMLLQRFKQGNFFVALLNKEIVGFAEYAKIDQTGMTYLHALYMGNDYQGKGIGTALLQIAVEKLEVKEIQLTVEERNEQALQFYLNKGFEVLETYQDDFYGYQIRNVHMSWTLESKE